MCRMSFHILYTCLVFQRPANLTVHAHALYATKRQETKIQEWRAAKTEKHAEYKLALPTQPF